MARSEAADPMARMLFRVLRDRSSADKRFVFGALSRQFLGENSEAKELGLVSLQLCVDDIGHAASRRNYDEWRTSQPHPAEHPSSTFIRTAFKGWTNALAALGVEGAPDVGVRRLTAQGSAYSREELIEGLRACGKELRTTDPLQIKYLESAREQLAEGRFARLCTSPVTFHRCFGTWSGALAAAFGSDSTWHGRRTHYTDSEFITFLRQAAETAYPARLTIALYDRLRTKANRSRPWGTRPLRCRRVHQLPHSSVSGDVAHWKGRSKPELPVACADRGERVDSARPTKWRVCGHRHRQPSGQG